MYQYTFDKETADKIINSTSNSGNLFKKFDEIDQKYNTISNSSAELKLEKMPIKSYTEDEIKTKAENNLFDYKTAGQNSINSGYDSKIKAVEDNVETVKKNAKESKAKVENSYAMVKENAENDAIKRGLARSSIIVNKLADYDQNMLSELEQQRTSTLEKIDSLKEQKSLLEQQKQNALGAFDITYAVKLQNEIESINDDIYKQNQTAQKYNNDIAEIMAKWERDAEDDFYKKSTELAKLADEYGSNLFDVLKQNEKYQLASEYFATLSKEDALAELQNNSSYKQNLGNSKYDKLLKEISSR